MCFRKFVAFHWLIITPRTYTVLERLFTTLGMSVIGETGLTDALVCLNLLLYSALLYIVPFKKIVHNFEPMNLHDKHHVSLFL